MTTPCRVPAIVVTSACGVAGAALGEAEIEHFHVVARPMKMFSGLISRWMMPSLCAASSASAICVPTSRSCVQAQRTRGEPIFQGRALHIFHHDELLRVLLADVVDCADVRVVERRCRLRFAREPAQRLGSARELVGDELERHRTAEAAYLRPCT